MKYNKQLKRFRKAFEEDGKCSVRTPKGFIFTAGGILSKIEDDEQFFWLNGAWVSEGETNIKEKELDNLTKMEGKTHGKNR